MQTKNLPTIDVGYWAAIVAASMCGANSGDLAAGPLGLGHVKGLLPLAIIFLVILFAEKSMKWTTVAFYWLAIIVLRTMATNLSDLGAHDMKIPYLVFIAGLIVFMAGMIVFEKSQGGDKSGIMGADGVWRGLPKTDWIYWVIMLAAGTLGTAIGDYLVEKDQIGLGVYWGSALCVPIFGVALWLGTSVGKMTTPWYWVVIVACRTLGTDLGDMLVAMFRTVTPTRPMGLWLSTVCTALLLTAIIYFWNRRRADQPVLAS